VKDISQFNRKCFGTLENPCRGFRIENVINTHKTVFHKTQTI